MSFTTHKLNNAGFEEVAQYKTEVVKVKKFIEKNIPEGRERSLALTKLEECSFWGTKAIASKPNNHEQETKY